MKKILSVLLTMAILAGMFIIPAGAATDEIGKNGYRAVAAGDYIYYVNGSGNLMRINKDGTNKKLLDGSYNNFSSENIFVTSDYIYGTYEDSGTHSKYNIKTGETEKITFKAQKGWKSPTRVIGVADGYIYYVFDSSDIRFGENGNKKYTDSYLYRDKLDKNGKPSLKNVTLIDSTEGVSKEYKGYYDDFKSSSYQIAIIANGYLYIRIGVADIEGSTTIYSYRMKPTGKSKTEFNDSAVWDSISSYSFRNIASDGYYYIVGYDISDNNKTDCIIRVDVIKNTVKKIVKGIIPRSVFTFDVDNGWFYYAVENKGIYKVKTNGSGKTKISDANVSWEWLSGLYAVGDFVMYKSASDGLYYAVKTDGTTKKPILLS